MLKLIILRMLLAIASIVCINVGYGLCKLSNGEENKDKKGTLAVGMLLCFILGGIVLYKLITM